MLLADLLNTFNNLCIGRIQPHKLVLNPHWKSAFLCLVGERNPDIEADGTIHRFQGAEVVYSESEPDFRFEDVRE